MSLARFIDRASDAAVPLLAADRDAFVERLAAATVSLSCTGAAAEDKAKQAGYLLAVNLAARLYPELVLNAPEALRARAVALAQAINPAIGLESATADAGLVFGGGSADEGAANGSQVIVDSEGWNALVDPDSASGPAAAPAALTAAAVGIGELFRVVFANDLGAKGRTGPQPGGFNLITFDEPSTAQLPINEPIAIGEAHLAGCGAIGEAAALTLAAYGKVKGTLFAIDFDPVELSNLQRYVLTTDDDVGARKPKLVDRILEGTEIDVVEINSRWGEDPRAGVGAETVLTALDSRQARIEVQAGLPRTIYNAWTQIGDLGCSRHEEFGAEQCLACLCWPRGKRKDLYQLIAEALGQHPLRISMYLSRKIPIGAPLPPPITATLRHPLPADASSWASRPLLDDVLRERETAGGADVASWRQKSVEQLYNEGVCGGGLIRPEAAGEDDVEVPLAHQSALAGVLVATQLLASSQPGLRQARSSAVEARYDVMTGFPQTLPRPAAKRDGCICSDPDFLAAYQRRWGQ